jgi:hypothetical protein
MATIPTKMAVPPMLPMGARRPEAPSAGAVVAVDRAGGVTTIVTRNNT